VLLQFKEQTKLEAEIIPLRLKADRATKAKEEGASAHVYTILLHVYTDSLLKYLKLCGLQRKLSFWPRAT
jgi:hypothetical protein